MKSNSMINMVTSNVILILLTLLAARTSGQPALMLLLGGGLMISMTAGFVRDGEGKLLKMVQLFLAVLFALCAGNWWGCLCFACLLWLSPWQAILLADAVAWLELVMTILGKSQGLFDFVLRGLWGRGVPLELQSRHALGILVATGFLMTFLIDGISAVILLSRWLLDRREQRDEDARRRIQSYSLGEMHEMRKSRELARQSFYVDKNARLLERENISRNIHNSVGHSITAAIMTLDAADVLFEKKPEEARKKMNDAAERIRGSLGAIRSAVRALDDESSDVSVKDLTCYFDNVLDEFLMDTERSCDRIYEFYEEERALPREHAEFLTGALEELLTNGVKHGGAMHFVVKLSGDSAHLCLEVKDDGRSDFSEETSAERIKNGFGLKKLASYAERCGGQTSFRNENGFQSVIELPI